MTEQPPKRMATAAQYKEVLRLHALGEGRNEIAKRTGVSNWTVTKIVEDTGKTFDRSGATVVALATTKADFAARRAKLAATMLDNAQYIASQMQQEFTAYSFGGKDNTFESERLPKPPPDALRNLAQAASVSAKTALDMERADGDSSADEKSLLAQLGLALGVVKAEQ